MSARSKLLVCIYTCEADDYLLLKTSEHYNNLPRKSFCMIRYLSDNLEFDYILKIDVTTLTTVIRNGLLTGGKSVSEYGVLKCINGDDFYSDYNGYVQLKAKRKGVENWANLKGISIDYEKVFESDETPPFYSGKLWLINREFASFITDQGEAMVDHFSKHFPAEDVMIGTLYQKYLAKRDSANCLRAIFGRLVNVFSRRGLGTL